MALCEPLCASLRSAGEPDGLEKQTCGRGVTSMKPHHSGLLHLGGRECSNTHYSFSTTLCLCEDTSPPNCSSRSVQWWIGHDWLYWAALWWELECNLSKGYWHELNNKNFSQLCSLYKQMLFIADNTKYLYKCLKLSVCSLFLQTCESTHMRMSVRAHARTHARRQLRVVCVRQCVHVSDCVSGR